MYSPIKNLFTNNTNTNTDNEIQVINKHCFAIIITGRCGSTWLGKLLDDTGRCGKVDEFFNEASIPLHLKAIGKATFDNYLFSIAQRFGFGDGFGFQIDPMRLAWLQPYKTMNFINLFRTAGRIFYMTRSDLLAQAYSFAVAKASGVWHEMKNNSHPTKERFHRIADCTLWEEMLSLLHDEYWAERAFSISGVKPIRLTYEELVADQIHIISKVLIAAGRFPKEGLNTNINQENITKKIKYSLREEILSEFYSKNFQVLIEIQEMRRKVVPLKDYLSLLDTHGIIINRKFVRWYNPPMPH